MIILFELSIICGYLFNGYVGFILSLIFLIYIFKKKDESFFSKIISFIILTIPTYNIGFIGDKVHHFLSWSNIFLYILLLYFIINFLKGKIKVKKINMLCTIIITTSLIISNLFSDYLMDELFNCVQILLMLVPLLFTYDSTDFLLKKVNKSNIEKWYNYIIISTVATALGVLIQYLYFNYTGIIVGQITIYPDRVAYDLLFKAYSVLSLYIGIGMTLNIKFFIDTGKYKYLILACICFIGIFINSARTGLVASIITIILILPKGFLKSKKPIRILLSGIIAVLVGSQVVNIMLNNRHTTNILDSNHRGETYIYGFNVLFENIKNFLFGRGLSLQNYTDILPHNFILETLTTTGIIVTTIIMYYCLIFLKKIKNSKYKCIAWYIFIGSMFITNFQGNTFATIIFIILIIDSTYSTRKNVY